MALITLEDEVSTSLESCPYGHRIFDVKYTETGHEYFDCRECPAVWTAEGAADETWAEDDLTEAERLGMR